LLDEWATSPVSLREVASVCGVSHTTAMRWKRGEAALPRGQRGTIAGLLAERDPERELVSVLGRHPEGVTVRQLEAELSSGRARHALRDQLARGDLSIAVVVRQRANGRRYECKVVVRPGAESQRKGAQVPGAALRGARRRRGLSSVQLGASTGLAPGTIRSLEARQAVPTGRLVDLTAALGKPLAGSEVRRLRNQAGWTLAELAARVGVKVPALSAWELEQKPIPPGRLILLEGALAEAQSGGSADAKRMAELEERIANHGPEGVSESELRHSFRRRTDGKHTPSPTLERDLAHLTRKGVIVRSRVAPSDRLGRPRERTVLVHSKWSPRREAAHPMMTGDALADARHRLGLTQHELAQAVGTHQSEINRLEHLHGRVLQAYWTARLRRALDDLAGRGARDDRLRSQLKAELRSHPGLPKWRLLEVVGHGKDVVRVLRQLVDSGEVLFDASWDGQGRRFRGLYLPGSPPVPSTLKPRQLRSMRERAGWSPAQLAAVLDVGHNTVTRWESGVRSCPPAMVEKIKGALKNPAPERPAERERRELILELAGHDGGVLRSELPPGLRGALAQKVIEQLLSQGQLQERQRLDSTVDGRRYPRTVLVAPETAPPEPPAAMSGQELEERRSAAGMTQTDLARELGLSTSAVQRWEARGAVPVGRVAAVKAVLRRDV